MIASPSSQDLQKPVAFHSLIRERSYGITFEVGKLG
jgi:hypothetical protein